jgi:hypothetical protein
MTLFLLTILTFALAQQNGPAKLIQTIPLPGVEGYFDHMGIDVKGQRLFLPAEHQRALIVVDIRSGTVIRTISGLEGNPRKTIYIPESNRIWVDLGSGICKAFSGDSYQEVESIRLNPGSPPEANREPDNGIYDPESGLFYIADRGDRAIPGAKGSIEIVDTRTGTYAGSITVEDADPAGLALDPSGSKLYVVLGMTSRLAVIDRRKREVINSWPITDGPLPHALALDVAHNRLFIGSRVKKGHIYKPGKMVVMDATSGKNVAVFDAEGGVDELVYEPAGKRVYFTGTTGGIDVFKQVDPDHYERLGLIPTSVIAKTSLLAAELQRLFVAVPKHIILTPPIPESKEASVEDARIMVFEINP